MSKEWTPVDDDYSFQGGDPKSGRSTWRPAEIAILAVLALLAVVSTIKAVWD